MTPVKTGFVCKALEEVMPKTGASRADRLTTVKAASLRLHKAYEAAEQAGGPYGLEHVQACLEVFREVAEEEAAHVPPNPPEREMFKNDLLAIEIALLYAWAKKPRSEGAEFGASQVREWGGGDLEALAQKVFYLIRVVRGGQKPETNAAKLIVEIALRATEREQARLRKRS